MLRTRFTMVVMSGHSRSSNIIEGHWRSLKVIERPLKVIEGHWRSLDFQIVFKWIITLPDKLFPNSWLKVSVSYCACMLASEFDPKSVSSESESEDLPLDRSSSSGIGGKFFRSWSSIFSTLSPSRATTERQRLGSDFGWFKVKVGHNECQGLNVSLFSVNTDNLRNIFHQKNPYFSIQSIMPYENVRKNFKSKLDRFYELFMIVLMIHESFNGDF